MPSQDENPSVPAGTSRIQIAIRPASGQSPVVAPTISATIAQAGQTSSHSATLLAYSRRRSAAGSSSTASARCGSLPRTFVAGTSASIQVASTMGKASAPWKWNSQSCRPTGRNLQQTITSPALPDTTSGAAGGAGTASRSSARTASTADPGPSAADASTVPVYGRRPSAPTFGTTAI